MTGDLGLQTIPRLAEIQRPLGHALFQFFPRLLLAENSQGDRLAAAQEEG